MRRNYIYIPFKRDANGQTRTARPEDLELKRTGTLNPHSDAVADLLFKENPFFDARDLLQVRYEMLRRHRAERMSILDAAAAFGVSRPPFIRRKQLSIGPAWPACCPVSGVQRVGTSSPSKSSTTWPP